VFLSPLVLEAAPNPDFWFVRAPLIWCDPLYGRVEVPIGFTTDLASIPRALRNLPAFDPNGRSRRPAVVHDWLYQWRGFTKPTADGFLRDAMVAEGCSPADADAFYAAVHWFGQSAWDDDGNRPMVAAFDTVGSFKLWEASNSKTADALPEPQAANSLPVPIVQ
jgi:hypothetical protein